MPVRHNIILNIRTKDGSNYCQTLSGDKNRYLLGRKTQSSKQIVDVAVPDQFASMRHSEIRWDEAKGWVVNDLHSTNGTLYNDEQITKPIKLEEGCKIGMGTVVIEVSFGDKVVDESHLSPPSSEVEGTLVTGSTMNLEGLIGASAEGTLVYHSSDFANASSDGTLVYHLPVDADATVMAPSTLAGGITPKPVKPQIEEEKANKTLSAASLLAKSLLGKMIEPKAASKPSSPKVEKSAEPPPPPKDYVIPTIAKPLVDSNLLTASKADSLINIARGSGKTFFRILAEDPSVSMKEEIYKLVAKNSGLELIDSDKKLQEEAVDVDWLRYLVAEQKGFIVLNSTDPTVVKIATIDPYDIQSIDWIRRAASTDDIQIEAVEKVLATPDAFFGAVLRLKNKVSGDEAGEIGIAIDITSDDESRIVSNVENIDVPQVVNYFLHRAYTQGASDIHIEATEEVLLVRNRVDGILHEDSSLPMSIHPAVASRVKIISGMNVAEKRRPQDGRIAAVIRGTPIDVRVSTFPTVYGEKIVMRLLDKNALRPSPESLGLLAKDLRLLKDKLNSPFGLIMISGPTGSGKTTTLYSCLGAIDKKSKNVLTVEDPVEYRLKGVHQMQVNDKIGLTFASGLRTILRQDPDVVMVGECRDTETAAMAIQASLTGHIVFSTIHTNDSIGVVTRLLDMGIDPFLVANALSLAIAQRLVRRVCKHCKTNVSGEDILDSLHHDGVSDLRLKELGIDIDPDLFYVKGAGCLHCRNTGYQGRQPVFELFQMTGECRNMVMSDNFNADRLREMAMHNGMTTLIDHGLRLVEEGMTTHEEVIRVLGEAA